MLPASNNEHFWNSDPFSRLFNQNFATIHHHLPLTMPSLPDNYWAHHVHRPRRPPPLAIPKEGDGEALWTSLNLNRDMFEVKLDVHQFLPEEITIKILDNYVSIMGKHEEKADPHGFISRKFQRRYLLPDNVKMDHVVCNLSSDGVLIITIPRLEGVLEGEKGIFLPITQTGRPALVHANMNSNAKANHRPHTPHCEQNGTCDNTSEIKV